MKEVTIDSVRERIANLELQANYSPIGGRLNEFEIACLRELLELLALREKTRRAVAYLKAVNDRSDPECKDVLVDYAIRELDGNDHRSALRERAEPVVYMNRFTGRAFELEQQPGADKDPDVYIPLYAAPPAPVVPKIDRKAICNKVHWLCARSPGATFYNAAEYALDEVIELLAPPAPVDVPNELVSELLDIAKRAAEEADECANAEFSDNSMKHAREIAEWERRAATLQPVSQPYKLPEWTNEQCLEFLAVAFRHAEIKGDFELDDLRLGVKMANAMAPVKEVN
ncbi:hypothetical protein ABUP50_001746 [Cronobacter malonaticus]